MYIVTFDLMIKYVCPPVLFGLFINQAVSDASVYSRGYENYPAWVHIVVGLLILGSMFGSLIAFAIFPGFWDKVTQDEGTSAPWVRSGLLTTVASA